MSDDLLTTVKAALDELEHDVDCPCHGDITPHSWECANCECYLSNIRALVAEVERLHTHEYHWRIEVQALRDRVAELTRFNLDAGSEVRRLHGLCHDGTHRCVCNAIASTDARWQQAEAMRREVTEAHGHALERISGYIVQIDAMQRDLAAARAVLDSAHEHADAVDWTTDQNIYVDRSAWAAWLASEAKQGLEGEHD